MKRDFENRCAIVIPLLLICALLSNSLASGAEKKIGQVSFLVGGVNDIKILRRSDADWKPVRLNTEVFTADQIQIGKESRCEVKLLDNSVVRIGENSIFEFSESNISKSKIDLKADLKKGKIWSNVHKVNPTGGGFQIRTPTAVCAVRGTIYRIDADSTTTCLVYEGAVNVGPAMLWGQPLTPGQKSLQPTEVQGPTEIPPPFEVTLEQWVEIVKGYQIIVRPDGKYEKSRFNVQEDNRLDWVRWNQERDRLLRPR